MADGPGGESSRPEGRGVRGPLSLLLAELARSPDQDLLSAWETRLGPGDVVGRFEILREIGRGGFGAVYQALDRELGRSVAFKTLRPSRSARELSADWIREEAEAVARLDHPAIVTLYDVGSCPSGPYLVEELLRGETLDERLHRGPLAPAEALAVGSQVAEGLAHAHERGVLHRDLKPANVFLTEDGRVKLLDFGLAHLLGTKRVHGGGTPAYMAPEQAAGKVADERADVFAAGVLLFEMVAGKRPFEVSEGRSASPDAGAAARLPKEVPAPLASLVGRCLSRDPARRPANGRTLAAELQGVQRALERPKQARRTALRLGLGVALGVALAVPLVGLLQRRAAPRPPAVQAVAVLPFVDMSPQKDQEYLSDGLAEEILNALTQVEGLRVTGRTSSFTFKGTNEDLRTIGRKLDVGAIVEGSVRRDGRRIRITAQLVKVSDGFHLWSKTFDRDLTGIFEIQEEIAGAVVQALRLKLMPGKPAGAEKRRPASFDAYGEYLLGRQFANQLDFRRALAQFEKAVALDPSYAPAWARLSTSIVAVPDWRRTAESSRENGRRAMQAAEKAIALAPDLADGYVARGQLRRLLLWDWEGAQADLERGLALDPRDARAMGTQAMLLLDRGSYAEAVETALRLVEVDPLSALAWAWLGAAYLGGGQFDLSRRAYGRALEIAPQNQVLAEVPGFLDLYEGKALAALAAASKLEAADSRLLLTALAEHDLGHAAAARSALDEYRARFGDAQPTRVAQIYAWRGERDLAFEWLERAHAQHDFDLGGIKTDPCLRTLRGDPRWERFLQKMKLTLD